MLCLVRREKKKRQKTLSTHQDIELTMKGGKRACNVLCFENEAVVTEMVEIRPNGMFCAKLNLFYSKCDIQ